MTTSPATFSPTCGPVANVTTASPVLTAARTGIAISAARAWIASAARTARSASSSWATGAPNTPMAASPMNLSSAPPKRSISSFASAWNGINVRRTSSGSAWSDRDVNPARSAKRIETTRRSSTGASVGPVSGSGVPQLGQKRPPGGTSVPHTAHVVPRGAPQPAQNRASSLFS